MNSLVNVGKILILAVLHTETTKNMFTFNSCAFCNDDSIGQPQVVQHNPWRNVLYNLPVQLPHTVLASFQSR